MDEVIEKYERANDLVKEGNLDQAIEEYKAGLALLKRPGSKDAASRINYFATKLTQVYWNQMRYEEARPYFEMMGQPMPKIPSKLQPFSKAVKTLQKVGLLADLSKKELVKLLDDMDIDPQSADEEMDLLGFLGIYYASQENGLSDRAVKDGFLAHDWRFHQETENIAGEICQLIGKPILQLESSSEIGDQFILVGEAKSSDSSTITIDCLEDLIAFVNQALARICDKRRFISIETNADYFACFLVDPTAYKAIFEGKSPALTFDRIPGVDKKGWLKA